MLMGKLISCLSFFLVVRYVTLSLVEFVNSLLIEINTDIGVCKRLLLLADGTFLTMIHNYRMNMLIFCVLAGCLEHCAIWAHVLWYIDGVKLQDKCCCAKSWH